MIKRMRGASRKSDIMSSPKPRSRSQEHSLNELNFGAIFLDDTASTESDEEPHDTAPYLHERAISLPVDAAEVYTHERKHALLNETFPTLPRYPMGETHDQNCWSEPPEDIFKVRGANYLRDENKVDSGPYLMRARGSDLLLVNGNPPENIGRYVRLLT
jgi:Protein ENHANCED DISEASE RESISTANCE 2, C-terminal